MKNSYHQEIWLLFIFVAKRQQPILFWETMGKEKKIIVFFLNLTLISLNNRKKYLNDGHSHLLKTQ